MTIDEAIAHYEWAAENAIGEVADESKQMAEWLRQARDAEKYKAGRNVLREQLLESRRANEHLFIELKYCKGILRTRLTPHELLDENIKLRESVSIMYEDMQGVLDLATDTVWAHSMATLRDYMDEHMESMAELGMPPSDYKQRMRELGIEVTP